MLERYKLAQVKAYLNICADTKHPLHGKIGRKVRTRLKRGKEWMAQAAQTIEDRGISVGAIRCGEACVQLNEIA